MKPTTPKPTEEQVQACFIWLESDTWDKDRWYAALDALFEWSNAHNNGHQYEDCCASEILASALAWARYEAEEDKARLDLLEQNQWHGGALTSPDMSGVTHRIQLGRGKPVEGRGFRATIDAARKGAA